MNSRSYSQILVATFILASFDTVAQSVRVTALDLTGKDLSDQVLNETAQQLRSLAPDVILLRGVPGWKMSVQIAEALKPAPYRVAACSAFGNGTRSGTNFIQAAIIARNGAYFSWSEPWKFEDISPSNSGFAIAAIEVAGHRFGFFSLNLPESPAIANVAMQQWLEAINVYRGWSNNRMEGFLVATFRPISYNGETSRMLRSSGFSELPPTSNLLPAKQLAEGHLVPNAESPQGLLLMQPQITCDFDFHAAPIVVVVTNSLVSEARGSPSTSRTNTIASIQPAFWWITGGLAVVLMTIITLLIGIRRKVNRLQTNGALVSSGSYSLVMAPTSTTMSALAELPSTVGHTQSLPGAPQPHEASSQYGLLAGFAQWLKQAFVQRLISDRQKLLADQHVAARKVSSVDERLARLETKIQLQTAAYEKEIELLNQKLLTAREENLELIRSQIKFLKSEMEATRARVLETEPL